MHLIFRDIFDLNAEILVHHLSHISFIEIELKNIDIQRNLQIKSQYLDIILNEEVNIEEIT